MCVSQSRSGAVVRSGSDFGAPHRRERWFCVAYSDMSRSKTVVKIPKFLEKMGKTQNRQPAQHSSMRTLWNNKKSSDWRGVGAESAVCRMDDGIPAGMDSAQHNRNRKERLKSLGNAIVPQASEWIGRQIVQSGLIDDLLD